MLLPSAARAQHEGHGTASPPGPQDPGPCAAGGRQALAAIDAASGRLESARQTNSPAEMRAAVADLQAILTAMRGQLAPCAAAQPARVDQNTREAQEPVKDPVEPGCTAPINPGTAPKADYNGRTYYFCSEGNRQKFLADPAKYTAHIHH